MKRVVWGYGGILVGLDSSNYAQFNNGTNAIQFEQVFNSYLTKSKVLRKRFKGWRVTVSSQIFNAFDGQTEPFVQFIEYLNQANANNDPLWVVPLISEDASPQLRPAYMMHFLGDINDVLIGVKSGQSLTLDFQAEQLIQSIPIYYADAQITNWVDESANQYVDQSGNEYTFLN